MGKAVRPRTLGQLGWRFGAEEDGKVLSAGRERLRDLQVANELITAGKPVGGIGNRILALALYQKKYGAHTST